MFSDLVSNLHVAEIWVANRFGASKPDWLNSPRLKTPLVEILTSQNLSRAIFQVTEIWAAHRYWASKPDWLSCPMFKTPLGEISTILLTLYSDWSILRVLYSDWSIFMILKVDWLIKVHWSTRIINILQCLLRLCFFDLWPLILTQTHTHTNYFFSYDPPYSRGNMNEFHISINLFLWFIWII